MRFGLDYTGNLTAAQHRAAGSSFACRYLSGGGSKDLDAGEAQALMAGNVDVIVVWETTAMRAMGGFAAGAADARTALTQGTRLGLPNHRPIYFAVDFDETGQQAITVGQYFRGVNSILGVARTGAYGGYWTIKRLDDAGLIAYIWQTYAWSGGLLHPGAHIHQYSNGHVVSGVGVDYNHALKDDFGQWGQTAPPPPPPPPPPEDTMNGPVTYTLPDGRVGLAVGTAAGEVKHIEQKAPNGDWWRDNDGKPNWLSLGFPGKD